MFIVTDGEFTIDPQYLSIKVIRNIWDRDPSPKKELATAQIGWLYHMYHPKSIYRDMREEQRSISIIMATVPKTHWNWDAELDDDFQPALKWYKTKLGETPIWDSVRAIEQSIYQLNQTLRDPLASASEKKTALELVSDVIQPKLRKLREQAERDEIIDIKIKADKDIKGGEKLENASRGRIAPPGARYKGIPPATFDHEANLTVPIPHVE